MSVYKGIIRQKPQLNLPNNGGYTELRWDRSSGESLQTFFQGGWGDMYSTLQLNKANWDSATITKAGSGTYYRLDLASNGDLYSEIYEISGTNISQNVLYSLVMRKKFTDVGAVAADYPQIVAEIAREVQKFKADQQTYEEMEEACQTAFPNAVANELMDYLCRAGDQFLQASYVFRYTVCASERLFNLNASTFSGIYNNVDRVHTEDQVRIAELVPDGFYFPPKVVDNSQPAEWLKQPPHAHMSLGQKRELVNEYLFADEWSRLVYADASVS